MKHSITFCFSVLCATLLSLRVQGQAAGLVEYVQGSKTTYMGDGTGKCLGFKFSIRYPASWTAADGNRPHIVQKFSSGEGAMAMVIIKDLKGIATKAQMDNFFSSDESIGEYSPGNLISVKRNFSIDGEKAYALEFSQGQTTASGMDVYQHGVEYVVFYDHYMITIYCAIGRAGVDNATIDARFAQSRFFFDSIASSLVLTSKWNKY